MQIKIEKAKDKPTNPGIKVIKAGIEDLPLKEHSRIEGDLEIVPDEIIIDESEVMKEMALNAAGISNSRKLQEKFKRDCNRAKEGRITWI